MNENDFWTEKLNQLFAEIEFYIKNNPGPHIAAFDADGTCWFNDVGRDFFLYQCRTSYKGLWTWDDYQKKEDIDVEQGLWWMAEINHGRTPKDILKEAQAALEETKDLKFVPSTLSLIEKLLKLNVEVYIVTASVKWSVVPALERIGISQDYVLGVSTEISDEGVFTKKRIEPLTWTEGKAEALLKATSGHLPFLCSGNSISDLALLDISKKFKVGIRSADKSERLYDRETQLMDLCMKHSWHHFDYKP